MKNIKLSLIALTILFAGCRKLISVAPPLNVLTKDKIYTDSASTEAVVVNTYALLEKTVDPNLTPFMGLYADELNYTSTNVATTEFQKSTISTTNATNLNIWKNYYAVIYQCNDIIQQLPNYNGIKTATKNQFINEAKFLRAYSYFYLTNLYGGVPLLLVTDVNITSVAARSDSASVYHQIIQDLTDAQYGLPISYIGSGRVRSNSLTATALLARVYLYQNEYAEAESTASTVISSGLYTPLQSPSSVFLAGSNESILQLYTQNGYVSETPSIVPSSGKPSYPITTQLLNSFESNDLRYCYELIIPDTVSGDTFRNYMFQDLYRYFGIKAEIEKRSIKCWSVTWVNEQHRKTIQNSDKAYFGESDNQLIVQNILVDDLFLELNEWFGDLPFLNNSGQNFKMSFKMEITKEKPLTLKRVMEELKLYGFRFDCKIDRYPILVLYDESSKI